MIEEDAHGSPGHTCLTGCASTYRRAMRERRLSRAAYLLNKINENQFDDEDFNSNSSQLKKKLSSSACSLSGGSSSSSSPCRSGESAHRKISPKSGGSLPSLNQGISKFIQNIEEQETEADVLGKEFDPGKRKSSLAKILTPQDPDLVVGEFSLVMGNNFDQYLQAIGAGPLSRNMVMRSKVYLSICQTVDKQWEIKTETSIKAKSLTGYATYNRKLVQNKFRENEAKPELLDDWDQRLVVTTVRREDDGTRLKLEQVAEKDQKYISDSTVIYSVDRSEPDMLTITYMMDNIIAWRKFRRISCKVPDPSRRHSTLY